MRSGFHATSVSVEQLFVGAKTLSIPDYQRPYSWTTREALLLLEDLQLAKSDQDTADPSASGYFLGSLLLMVSGSISPDSSDAIVSEDRDIIDGQQRIVTLTILLAVLRDLTADAGGSLTELVRPLLWSDCAATSLASPRVVLRGREQQFMHTHVQLPGASTIMPESDDLSASEARIIAVREQFVENLVALTIEELTRLAIFVMRHCHFALITTRSIDRAHRIFSVLNGRGRPLARNDILKAQILGGIASERRKLHTPIWDRIEQRLGSDFETLFSHIRAVEGLGRERVISGISNLIESSGNAEIFLNNVLVPYASIYETMQLRPSSPGDPFAKACKHLSYLSWLGSEDWAPAMMSFWRASNGDPIAIGDFAERLERLAYCLRLLGLGAEKRQARYNAVLKSIRLGTWQAVSENPLELTRDEVRNIQYNLRNLHGRSQLTCKLVLLRLNDEIAGTPQCYDPGDYTVEHVLPQKPGKNSLWRTCFPTADEREKCTQSMGNLVLVTRTQNDRARNMELSRKLEIYFSEGVEQAPAITREFWGIEEWSPEKVIERERRLLLMVQKLWRFEPHRSD